MGNVRHQLLETSSSSGVLWSPSLGALLSPVVAVLWRARPIRSSGPHTRDVDSTRRHEKFAVSTTIDSVKHAGASIKVAGGADEARLLLHPIFAVRIKSPGVLKPRRRRITLKTVVSGAEVREGVAGFHLPFEAHASKGPSPPMCTRSLFNMAMNRRSNDLIVAFNASKSIKAGVGITSEITMFVLRGPRAHGPDLINGLVIKVVSMATLGQIGADDQNGAQQHEGSKSSDTSPADERSATSVDGHSRQEIRATSKDKVPITRSQGVDLRRGTGNCGPRLTEASVDGPLGRWLPDAAVIADGTVSERIGSHRIRCNSVGSILAAFERFLQAEDMPRSALGDMGEERGEALSACVLDAIHVP